MQTKEKTLLELYEQSEKNDLISLQKNFHEIINLIYNLFEKCFLNETKNNNDRKYQQVQLYKFISNSSSLLYLIQGTPIINNTKDEKYPDLGSIYLLARAQIENYLIFFYLYLQPDTKDEADFKLYLYELSGLNLRQQFNYTTKEQKEKKNKEKLEIDELIEKIKHNNYFYHLSAKKRKDLLYRKPAKTMSWSELITSSYLNEEHFMKMWRLYSNYAHSEIICYIQIAEYTKNPIELKNTLFTTLQLATILCCILIKDLDNKYKNVNDFLDKQSEELIVRVNFFDGIGRKK